MHLNLNDIFLVPHRDKFVLHAPLHGVTSLISADAAAELHAFLCTRELQNLSLSLRPVGVSLLQRQAEFPRIATGPFAPRQIGLLPTNDCNMRCLYCAPNAGSQDRSYMSNEICETALRYQASVVKRERYPNFIVSYFGGEPFLAWDLVQFCDSKARSLAESIGVPFHCVCDTNGFMPKEHARWVAHHLSYVVVSLDGPESVHNLYRPSTSNKATHGVIVRNLHIFEEEGLPFVLRCSVSSEIVQQLPEITEYFCREFRPTKINFDPLVPHGRCLESNLVPPEPNSYVRAIVESGRIARAYGVALKLSTVQLERLAQSCCPIAQDHLVITPDGLATSCYSANHESSPYATEFAIGRVDLSTRTLRIDQECAEKIRAYAVQNIPRCRDCFCKWHCSGGCRLFQTRPFSEKPPGPLCLITQKLTLWRMLEAMRLYGEADRVSLEPEEAENVCA